MNLSDDKTTSPLSTGDIVRDIKNWIDRFLKQKDLENLAEKTKKSYSFALESFKQFVEKYSQDNTIENIGAKFVNRFLIEYQEQIAYKKLKEGKIDTELYQKIYRQTKEKNIGKNDAGFFIADKFKNTLLHRLTTVKMLLKYISENNENGYDYQTVFHSFVKIKLKDNNTKYLTVDELDRVIDLMVKWHENYKEYKPKQEMHKAYRDALLILLYALTGARSAEVVQIKLKDIRDFSFRGREYYNIAILNTKGGKPREVVVEKDFIEHYVEYFRKELPSEDYYISSSFASGIYVNKHYHEDSIRRFGNFLINDVLELGEKTGLHLFRRAYATKRIINDKEELAIVSAELGNTISVLVKYYFKYDARIALENKK